MALKDKNTTGLNRRSFMKGAGLAALAGGAVASAPSSSLAQESSINIPKLAGGKYDFDTIVWDQTARGGIHQRFVIQTVPLSLVWV